MPYPDAPTLELRTSKSGRSGWGPTGALGPVTLGDLTKHARSGKFGTLPQNKVKILARCAPAP